AGPGFGAATGSPGGTGAGGLEAAPAPVTSLGHPGPGRHAEGEFRGGASDSTEDAGAAAATPSGVTPLAHPAARRRTRRPLKVAFGALVAAAAASVVVGMGWLVTQTGTSSDDAGSKAAADSAAGEQGGGVAFGSPRYLACARTVVEGTVSAVKPTPSGEFERVTLTVTRPYKAEEGRTEELTFPIATVGRPRLHVGALVLVGIPLGDQFPDMVIVGEKNIAPERARITASLPESRTLTCE
ncbi:hypothetical protein N4P33_27375, partial [Streptomyces sp. 15-116A]|uniref:hypothetical protein n=1 Tax=Streptomyces sp. 15-116A TaxID=2259035 RepID=UPI0021B45307